jgi:hypothetical protein
MTVTVVNGPTIAQGQSLSAPLDLGTQKILRITMPAAWDMEHVSPVITFQISTDGIGYNDVFDKDGSEFHMVVVPGSAVLIGNDMTAVGFLKIRSGMRGRPIPQSQIRTFALAVTDIL